MKFREIHPVKRLTAKTLDNVGKLVPEWQTVLDFKPARENGGGSGASRSSNVCTSQVAISVPTLGCFTGRIPFLLPNQQHPITEGSEFTEVVRLNCGLDNIRHMMHVVFHSCHYCMCIVFSLQEQVMNIH